MSSLVSLSSRRWWVAESVGEGRWAALDALRGAMALCVAVYHLSSWTELFPSGTFWNMAWAKLGNFGVSAFFVLSGFVLFRLFPMPKIREEGLLRFWARRFLRLMPIFYLAVALNLAFALGMGPQASWRMVVENVTLTFGAIHPNHALATGGWYVGLVALFYGFYPMAAWCEEKGGWCFLLLLTVGLWWWSLPATLHIVPDAPMSDRFHHYVLPGNQLFLFAVGALLAWLHARISWRLSGRATWLVVAVLLAILLWPWPRFYDHLQVMTGWIRYGYILIVSFIVLAFTLQSGHAGWVGKQLGRVGTWSFALYLLHPFLFRLLTPTLQGWRAFLATLASSLCVAALVTRWLEAPLLSLILPGKRSAVRR